MSTYGSRRPAVSRAFSGARSCKLPCYRTALKTEPLRCCAHFALAERQYDASTNVGWVRSSLSLLFAANPGESFAKVRVDALRVAKRRIEDRFHGISYSRLRDMRFPQHVACKSCS
jgi:hypothetical protein